MTDKKGSKEKNILEQPGHTHLASDRCHKWYAHCLLSKHAVIDNSSITRQTSIVLKSLK